MRMQGQALPTETEQNIDSISGIAATGTMSDRKTSQFDFVIALKPKPISKK